MFEKLHSSLPGVLCINSNIISDRNLHKILSDGYFGTVVKLIMRIFYKYQCADYHTTV